MKHFLNPIFVSLVFLGISVYLLQYIGCDLPPIIHNHLNDLLVIPIVLWISFAVLRLLLPNKFTYIPWSYIIFVVIGYSIYFEYYLPRVNQRYTGDLWDISCYALGGLFFYFWQRNKSL